MGDLPFFTSIWVGSVMFSTLALQNSWEALQVFWRLVYKLCVSTTERSWTLNFYEYFQNYLAYVYLRL